MPCRARWRVRDTIKTSSATKPKVKVSKTQRFYIQVCSIAASIALNVCCSSLSCLHPCPAARSCKPWISPSKGALEQALEERLTSATSLSCPRIDKWSGKASAHPASSGLVSTSSQVHQPKVHFLSLLEAYRNLLCERGLLHRADGSAKFFLGKTCVLACVYGPSSTATRRENAEQAVIEVQYRPAAGLAGKLKLVHWNSAHPAVAKHIKGVS